GTVPVARFSTAIGDIDVNLDTINTPQTYGNFLHYANGGLWDFTLFHRSLPGFVVQGGGFNVDLNTDDIGLIPTLASPQNEFHTSNTRGTIAMAKVGGNPNSATDQWFFNLADNGGGAPQLDTQNGGFTVFGAVKNAGGLAVMDGLAALPTKNLAESAHD